MGISQQEALDLFASDDFVGIGMAANEVRRKKTDPRVATYQIDRNINYTNFCTEYCSFCAFYRPMGSKEGYVLSFEEICHKIDEMLELGGTGVLLQGGLNPDLKLEYYENLLSSLKQKYPRVHLHCFSAPEIICIAEISNLSVRDTIARLRDAGLESIPGGGAEILDDEVRARISRLKCTSNEWELARPAHHGDDDVRLRRGYSPSRESFRARPAFAGRDRRIHRIHPVDFRAGSYFSRKKSAGNHRSGLSEDARDQPPLSRQHRPHSIELADAGNQDLPGGLAVRRRRRWQHFD
jgi:hypothetical protein